MSPEHVISIKGKALPVLFTVGSVSRLQRETGLRLGDFINMFSASPDLQQAADAGDMEQVARLWFQQTGLLEIQGLLFAGLEGARAKERYRSTPYTFDQVGDLLEEADGGMMAVFQALVPAFTDFLRRFMAIKEGSGEEGGDSKNAEAEESSTPAKKTSGKGSTSRASKRA